MSDLPHRVALGLVPSKLYEDFATLLLLLSQNSSRSVYRCIHVRLPARPRQKITRRSLHTNFKVDNHHCGLTREREGASI
jgi:hypothetical protein